MLSASGLSFELFRNLGGVHAPADAAQAGQGWKFYHAELNGFGGCNNSFVASDADVITPLDGAHIKFALALPYQGFGYHQGLPVWAGSAGRWDVDDII